MKKIMLVLVAVGIVLITGCTRVETGHVGIRTTFTGTVDPQELSVGFHQTLVGTVHTYVANEITWKIDNLTPQTKDRSQLEDLDLAYTYTVNPSSIAELIVKYKGRDAVDPDNGDRYPLALYVENVVKTATTDVVSHYDALEANEKREQIRREIRTQAESIFKEDGLETAVQIHQVFVKNLQLSKAIMTSANTVIISQNELKSKEFEVQTARKESERLSFLSSNKSNIDYLAVENQRLMVLALTANKNVVYVIPNNMTSLMVK